MSALNSFNSYNLKKSFKKKLMNYKQCSNSSEFRNCKFFTDKEEQNILFKIAKLFFSINVNVQYIIYLEKSFNSEKITLHTHTHKWAVFPKDKKKVKNPQKYKAHYQVPVALWYRSTIFIYHPN